MLHQMWFELYSRDGARDSSGFEHVFVGEHDTSDGELAAADAPLYAGL
jgi:hypothetical protein